MIIKIPKEAKPHEVAILVLRNQGKSIKHIANELHYKRSEPVRIVIRRWENHFTLVKG